jgi:response regulator RpfG family c-di-GMP phosphodiesterase
MLRDACRNEDVVARQAGDEFTILLPGSGPRESIAIAQRIHDALAARDWRYPGQDGVVVRTSIGIACYPMDGADEEMLLIMADRAMYAAKAAGGGQTRIASRLTAREKSADTSRQLRFGVLETLANRLAARTHNETNAMHTFAEATAQAAWLIGEHLSLEDAEQQVLRVAALSHAIGVVGDDDPRALPDRLGLDADLDPLYLKIGKVFVAASPGLNDAVRVIARHHRVVDPRDAEQTTRLARILAVSERYAELITSESPVHPAEAIARLKKDTTMDPELVQTLDDALNAPAVWRAA